MDTKDIFNSITAAANLAGATISELGGKGGTADIMTNVMKMFRIEFSERNTNYVADVLTKAVTKSNTNLYDLAEAIKYAGTTVTNLGASIEQTSAFIGVLGNAGIQGSMAGTAMANTYRYLTKSIEDTKFKGHKALKSLGLDKADLVDSNGQLLDMGIAMQKISKAMSGKGLSETERFNTLVSILGVRGERGGSVMVKAFEDYGKLLGLIQDSSGISGRMMEDQMANIAGSIDKVVSSFENIKTTYTTSIAPVINPLFNAVAFVFDNIRALIGTPYLGTLITGVLTFGTALVTVRLAVISLKAGFRLMFNDSTVSFKNMILVWKQGWRSATISAHEYKMVQAGIIAQQKAGLVSNTIGRNTFMGAAVSTGLANNLQFMMANPKTSVGGYFFSKGKWFKKTAGGTVFASKSKMLSDLGSKSMSSIGRISGMGIRGAAAGIGGGLLRGLGTVTSLLGGPIGIGLTALTFFLPSIISSLTSNKQSNDKNTEALNYANSLKEDELKRKREEILKNVTPGADKLTKEEESIVLLRAIRDLLNQNGGRGKPTTLNLYLNGKLSSSGNVDLEDDINLEMGVK